MKKSWGKILPNKPKWIRCEEMVRIIIETFRESNNMCERMCEISLVVIIIGFCCCIYILFSLTHFFLSILITSHNIRRRRYEEWIEKALEKHFSSLCDMFDFLSPLHMHEDEQKKLKNLFNITQQRVSEYLCVSLVQSAGFSMLICERDSVGSAGKNSVFRWCCCWCFLRWKYFFYHREMNEEREGGENEKRIVCMILMLF